MLVSGLHWHAVRSPRFPLEKTLFISQWPPSCSRIRFTRRRDARNVWSFARARISSTHFVSRKLERISRARTAKTPSMVSRRRGDTGLPRSTYILSLTPYPIVLIAHPRKIVALSRAHGGYFNRSALLATSPRWKTTLTLSRSSELGLSR